MSRLLGPIRQNGYVVRDKMAKRWKKKIDIYMGNDVDAARKWGVRPVTIRWQNDS